MTTVSYAGKELALFAKARNWKAYVASLIKPHIQGSVLEVGAGIGTNFRLLRPGHNGRWLSIEPDTSCYRTLCIAMETKGSDFSALNCTIADVDDDRVFDTVLYLDVLEHIEDDCGELRCAAHHLRSGGKLVVLAPAIPRLYSEFDRAIGHFRRYNRSSLLSIVPAEFAIVKNQYIDVVGMAANLLNRLMLWQQQPTAAQIRLWDRVMVPASRLLDAVLLHCAGKSILLVAQKRMEGHGELG